MIVNQWVPAAHRGDAIGDSARRMQGMLRSMGHVSELYALTIDEDLRDEVRPFEDPASRKADVTIFHYALPSQMTEALKVGAAGVLMKTAATELLYQCLRSVVKGQYWVGRDMVGSVVEALATARRSETNGRSSPTFLSRSQR